MGAIRGIGAIGAHELLTEVDEVFIRRISIIFRRGFLSVVMRFRFCFGLWLTNTVKFKLPEATAKTARSTIIENTWAIKNYVIN